MLVDYPWFQPITASLQQALTNGRLPHALLLAAPAASGKQQYALAVAQSMFCQQDTALDGGCGQCKACQLFQAETHPDFYLVDRLTDNKGKQKKSIGIDQIRLLNDKLQDTPQLSGWRVAVICSVSAMTTSSFNSLLKTLEEPGKDTLLILLADNVQTIPATIRSRCQLLLPDLATDKLMGWLSQETGFPDEKIEKALADCYSAPLAARDYLFNEGAKEKQAIFQLLDSMLNNQLTPGELLQQVDLDDDDLINRVADYLFQAQKCQMLAADNLRYQAVPVKLIFQLYDKVLQLKRAQLAGSNLQTRLQIEAILIQWFEIGRKISHYSKA